MDYQIRDITLAESGRKKIEWVKQYMPILSELEEEFSKTKPFEGVKISLSVHLEAKTVFVKGSGGRQGTDVCYRQQSLSTQDDVAAALVADGIQVFAWHGSTEEEYARHIEMTLEHGPNIIIDDGETLFLPCIPKSRT